MKNYQLIPTVGWEVFARNKELSECIYEKFMPLVNDNEWNYTNFTSDTGSFEDELGNCLVIEFENDFEKSEDAILGLNINIVSANKVAQCFLERTMINIANEFELYVEKH